MLLLDTSALIAAVKEEVGAAAVEAAIEEACVSAPIWVETIAWIRRYRPASEAGLRASGLPVLPFGQAEAEIAIRLLAAHHGVLSLGDCACLATAITQELPVLTADRIWATLGLPVEVRLIR